MCGCKKITSQIYQGWEKIQIQSGSGRWSITVLRVSEPLTKIPLPGCYTRAFLAHPLIGWGSTNISNCSEVRLEKAISTGLWNLAQQPLGRKQGTPWINHQPIKHTPDHTKGQFRVIYSSTL